MLGKHRENDNSCNRYIGFFPSFLDFSFLSNTAPTIG